MRINIYYIIINKNNVIILDRRYALMTIQEKALELHETRLSDLTP